MSTKLAIAQIGSQRSKFRHNLPKRVKVRPWPRQAS
jgi:hypothetical protein